MTARIPLLAADPMIHGINMAAVLFAAAVIGGILLVVHVLSSLFGGK